MDYALLFVTLAVGSLTSALIVFIGVLTWRRLAQKVWLRRWQRAKQEYQPWVQRVRQGLATADDLPPKIRPGSLRWLVLEELVREAMRASTGDEIVRLRAVLANEHFTDHQVRELSHGSLWQRVTAATRLAEYQNPSVVPALIRATRDPAPPVRTAAIRALGRLGEGEALSALAQALEHVSAGQMALSQRVVSGALSRFGSRAVPVIGPLLTHPSWRVRSAALTVLGDVGAYAWLPAIIERMEDPESDVRAKAVRALGKMRVGSALLPILSRLEDEVWLVRMHAARALGRLGRGSAVNALTRRLSDLHWRVRQEAARALARLGPVAVSALTQTVLTAQDVFAREQVVDELQRTPVLRDAVDQLALVPEERARIDAEALLIAIGETGAVSPHLNGIKGHPSAQVRRRLIELVEPWPFERIDTTLRQVSRNDSDPMVRQRAELVLARRITDEQVA